MFKRSKSSKEIHGTKLTKSRSTKSKASKLVGVSIETLLGIVEKSNEDWSLEDVLIKIVLPATEKSRKSFSRTIPVDQISPKFIFVAVPRSSCYHHLVDAIQRRVNHNIPKQEQFFWIDIFCLNHHENTSDEELINDRHRIISVIERLFIFYDSIENASCLKRAWTLWELYGAQKHNAKVDILVAHHAEQGTIFLLDKEFDKTLNSLSELSWGNSMADRVEQKEQIEFLLSKENALANFDKMMKRFMLKAGLRYAERIVAGIRDDEEDFFDENADLIQKLSKSIGFAYENRLNLPYEAEPYLAEVLDSEKREKGDKDEATIQTMILFAKVEYELGRFIEAESTYRKLLHTFDELTGKESRVSAAVLGKLAEVVRSRGKLEDAVALYQKTLDILRKLNENPQTIAETMHGYAETLLLLSRYDEAHDLVVESINSLESSSASALALATECTLLAKILEKQGKNSEAESNLEKALQLRRAELDENDPLVGQSLMNLGTYLNSQGRNSEAKDKLEEAVNLLCGNFGTMHPQVANAKSQLAIALQELDKLDEAETLFLEALSIQQTVLGDDHIETATSLNNLGNHYRIRHKYHQAENYLNEAVSVLKHSYGTLHPQVALAMWNQAVMLKKMNKIEEARTIWEEALKIYEKTLGVDSGQYVRCKDWWAET